MDEECFAGEEAITGRCCLIYRAQMPQRMYSGTHQVHKGSICVGGDQRVTLQGLSLMLCEKVKSYAKPLN